MTATRSGPHGRAGRISAIAAQSAGRARAAPLAGASPGRGTSGFSVACVALSLAAAERKPRDSDRSYEKKWTSNHATRSGATWRQGFEDEFWSTYAGQRRMVSAWRPELISEGLVRYSPSAPVVNRGRTLRRLFFSSALALIPASVGASSRSVGLTVLRSAQALDCPDGAQLRSQVEQILQHSLTESRAAAEAVRIQVEFSRTGDGYAAQVLFQDPKPGERALQDRGERCSALAQAVSVTIALFLDQELVQDQPAKNANATKEASAAPIAGSPSRKEPPVRDAEPRSWQARGALEGGAGWFTSNTLQPVLALELGVKAKRFILEAGLVGVLPDSSRFGAGEVRTSLLLGVARACYAFGARLSFGPCAEFGLGSVRGSGLGYAESRSVALLWSAVGVGALFEGELGSRGFGGASAVLWLPTRRQTFSVENAGIAWESRTFSLALLLRAGVRLW